MEERIREFKKQLELLLEEYEKLNRKTKGAFNWREQAIRSQIDALDTILIGDTDLEIANWNVCLIEDKRDANL
jgi:hypothetical protein